MKHNYCICLYIDVRHELSEYLKQLLCDSFVYSVQGALNISVLHVFAMLSNYEPLSL